MPSFEKLFDILSNLNTYKILLIRDFNTNMLNYETHHDTGEFLNSIFSYQYPTILQPTRLCSTNSTLIICSPIVQLINIVLVSHRSQTF